MRCDPIGIEPWSAVSDPGFWDGGDTSLDKGRQFGKGGARSDAILAVCGWKLKNRRSLSKIGARLLRPLDPPLEWWLSWSS